MNYSLQMLLLVSSFFISSCLAKENTRAEPRSAADSKTKGQDPARVRLSSHGMLAKDDVTRLKRAKLHPGPPRAVLHLAAQAT